MNDLILLGLTTALINNLLLTQLLGVESLPNASKNLKSAAKFGLLVVFVMLFATVLTWYTNSVLQYLHGIFSAEHLQTLVFVMVVAGFAQLCSLIVRKKIPALHKQIGKDFKSVTVNSAILGIAITNIGEYALLGDGLIRSIINGGMAALSFLIALVLLAGIRERLELHNVPKPLQGIPIALISAALIAIPFMALR